MSCRSAVLELTNRCNLRCPHCASNSGRARPAELSAQEWAPVIRDLRTIGCEEITLLGGELFLFPGWVDVARTIRELGIRLCVVTNGLLVKGRTLEALRSLELERIGVSYDGVTKETFLATRGVDAAESTWRLLERLRDDARTPVNAITTFSGLNIHELERFIERLRDSGITWQVQIATNASERFTSQMQLTRAQFAALARRIGELMLETPLTPWVASMDDIGYFPVDPLLSRLHDRWPGCQAGTSVIGLRANGDVLGCLSLGDAFIESNVRRRPLVELWRDPASFASLRSKERHLGGACARCPKGPECRAGCTGMAFGATGSIGENPWCLRAIEVEQLTAALQRC